MVHWLAAGDRFGDQRRGERGLVGFIVTLATVAIHVDHHIAAELLAEIECELRGPPEFLGSFAVDVQDRRFDHFGDVGRIS